MLKSPSLRTLDCPMSLYVTYVHCGTWSSFYGMKPWVNTPAVVWLQGHLCCLLLDMKIHRSAQDTSSFGRILWWSLKDQREGPPLCSANCSDHRVCPALRTQAWIVWVSKLAEGTRKGYEPGRDINHSLQRARNKQKSCSHDAWIAPMWCTSHMRLAYNAIGIRNFFEASIVRKGWAYQWANLKGL